MTTKAAPEPATQRRPELPFPIQITTSGRKALKRYEREISTYLRELPQLLTDGQAGRYVLAKGDELLSVSESQDEAIQAGRERFGTEPIFVKKIDSRDPDRFALLDIHRDSPCPS